MKCDYNLKKNKNLKYHLWPIFKLENHILSYQQCQINIYILQTICASPFCLNSKPVRDPARQDMHMLQHNTD